MSKVKLNIDGKTVPQKLTVSQTVITQSTNNANLPDTNPPTVVTLNAKRYSMQVALANADAARQASQTATQALDTAEGEFDDAYSAHGAYVQNGTGGDATKILSTGFDVAVQTSAPISLVAPTGFATTAGDEAGEIMSQWNPLHGAGNYETHVTTDLTGATGWGNSTFGKKSRSEIKNLVPGTMYLVRVRALGAQGAGPWSQAIEQRAP